MPKGTRNATLVRALRLWRYLEGGKGHRLRALAQHFKVNPRTIRRDLHALRAAGEPIYHSVKGRRWWRGESHG